MWTLPGDSLTPEEGGGGVQEPLNLADVICEQPLVDQRMWTSPGDSLTLEEGATFDSRGTGVPGLPTVDRRRRTNRSVRLLTTSAAPRPYRRRCYCEPFS